MSYICPVCGYPELEEPPRRPGGGGSYEICPSCRFEFGVTDDDKHYSYEQWRKKWIDDGMEWRSSVTPPRPDWNPKKQLENLSRLSGSSV